MRMSPRGGKSARLAIEVLEDRVTPALAYGLTVNGGLFSFDTAAVGTSIVFGTIGNVATGETLVGIDIRPATGQLYALGFNAAGTAGTLYTISVGAASATATAVGAVGSIAPTGTATLPATGGFGFDFNPTVDLIRVTSTGGQSYTLNPSTGAINNQQPTLGAPGTADASAYTNNAPGATATTLYSIDSSGATDQLYIQTPGTSVLTARPNALGIDAITANGFDIPAGINVGTSGDPAAGNGILLTRLSAGTVQQVYTVDLTTGIATLVGNQATIGGADVRGLAVTNGGTIAFQSATVSGTEGTTVSVVLTRTGATAPQQATVTVTGGSASPGADFAAGPYVVTFAAGATTATLNIPLANDGLVESAETVSLRITEVTNGTFGAQATATLTINDGTQRFNQAFGTGSAIAGVATIPAGSTTPNVTLPYGNVAGGVRVAVGDVNGDGFLDLVTVPTLGSPLVKVFSGADGSQLASFFAYPPSANIPASVAVGDLNNDGFGDIIIGTNTTLAAILIFDGRTLAQTGIFLPFGNLPVGVNVAVGDTDGDGRLDIIAGTATGLAAIGYYDGQTFAQKQIFLPFGTFFGGVTVAAGDLDGDNKDEVVVGIASQIPAVAVYNGVTQQRIFLPFGAGLNSGVNVAAYDANGDNQVDIVAGLATGLAVAGQFDGQTLALINNLLPFGGFVGGIFVG